MVNKDNQTEKRRQRVSSSEVSVSEDSQDGAFIKLTVTEYQALIAKLTTIKDRDKTRNRHILNLEARLDEAQLEIQTLKTKLHDTNTFVAVTKKSIEFTQGEHDELTVFRTSRSGTTKFEDTPTEIMCTGSTSRFVLV